MGVWHRSPLLRGASLSCCVSPPPPAPREEHSLEGLGPDFPASTGFVLVVLLSGRVDVEGSGGGCLLLSPSEGTLVICAHDLELGWQVPNTLFLSSLCWSYHGHSPGAEPKSLHGGGGHTLMGLLGASLLPALPPAWVILARPVCTHRQQEALPFQEDYVLFLSCSVFSAVETPALRVQNTRHHTPLRPFPCSDTHWLPSRLPGTMSPGTGPSFLRCWSRSVPDSGPSRSRWHRPV